MTRRHQMPQRLMVAILTVAFCFLGAIATHSQERAHSAYAIVERWPVGGSGGWDYLALDASGSRLFVTRANRVDIISTMSGAIVGSVADTAGVHGVALAPELERGYTSNGGAASVTEFDLDTLRTLRVAKVSGTNPDAIVFEPIGNHVLTFNGASSNATVLDARTLDVVATIALPDKPEFAVVDGAGRVFVNIQSAQGQMVVIDARTLAVIATWPLPGCARPTGLALDRAHQRLFSVCEAKIMAVTDASSGRHVADIPIGEHPDAAAFDPALGLVFSSNGDGTLTVVQQLDADHYRTSATLPTQKSARTLALDPRSHRVYLVAAQFGPAPQTTAALPRPRPPVLPDSFTILVAAPR
jgi:DNA-binding beta-propeller fold protein YncE